MANPLRHLAAIRTRLLSIPGVVALVGDRVYTRHIFEITDPNYPCITLFQAGGNHVVWADRLFEGQIQIDCYGKDDDGEMDVINLHDYLIDVLHLHKTMTSSESACFHEIREVFSALPFWDRDTNAWRATSRYWVRVSTH